MNTWFVNPFAEDIWKTKYAHTYTDIQKYFSDLADIVSLGDKNLKDKFFSLLWEKKFLPGGRILAFAGKTGAFVSLMNCTTHKIQGDTLEDISRASYAIMRASSRGQGIGVDLSTLRPRGSPVNNAARTSTGAISFMEMLAAVGKTIGQEGRRAALLFSLRVDHPDLWRPNDSDEITCPTCSGKGCAKCDGKGSFSYDFLHVKRSPYKVENANISVMITDDFMNSVITDELWEPSFTGKSGKEPFTAQHSAIKAKDVFAKISESAWKSAEPGLLMWDTSVRMSNSDLFGFPIVGVNACSEQVLDHEGVCNLGSMNLAAYVINPFTEKADFDFVKFARDVKTAVSFLDNVLEVELTQGTPISHIQENAIQQLRRVGLGVMGLGDVFAMMGLRYGGETSLLLTEDIFEALRDAAYRHSINLAKAGGPAPVWLDKTEEQRAEIVEQGFFNTLPGDIKEEIVKYGTRNITLLSVAPTGTISNLLGVTSGIEPLFAERYTRRLKMRGGEDEFVEYIHPGVALAESMGAKDTYTTAYDVTPMEHIYLQATAQNFVDQSISKTVNLPKDATPKDVGAVYLTAWGLGIKGLTVYRDGSRDEQILYVAADPVETCPNCGNGLTHKEGCKECSSCGWSACSL